MVKIRLRRVGAKKQPSYRVVIADSRSPRNGRFIENIGHYNPRTEPPTIVINERRALHWLSNGAQPTEAVERMLRNMGTFEKLTRMRNGEDWESIFPPDLASPEEDLEVSVDEQVVEETDAAEEEVSTVGEQTVSVDESAA